VLNGEFIGKPKNKQEAIKILKKISGKKLKVYSGIAIIKVENCKIVKALKDHEWLM
jgi:septum formation protein